MRNMKWLRYGLASMMVMGAGFGGFLVACGDDDSNPSNPADGGSDSNNNTDSAGNDSGNDSGDVDAGQPAKLIIVHAATDLGEDNASDAVRICFATAPKATPTDFAITPFPVLPHTASPGLPFPGIFAGTGGVFPQSGADLEDLVVRPYLMNAERLAARGIVGNAAEVPRCNRVLAPGFGADAGDAGLGPLVANVDYWQLPDVPAGSFKKNHTYVLAVTGCSTDSTAGAACGPADNGSTFIPSGDGNPGLGNLKLSIIEIDGEATVAADEFGVQLIHASPTYQAGVTATTLPPANPVFSETDGGAPIPILADGGTFTYDRAVTKGSTLTKLKGVTTGSAVAVSPALPAGLRFPLNSATATPSIQQFSGVGDPATPFYTPGKAYTFILVGSPTANPETEPTKLLHFLAFPNQFTPPPLQ